MSSVGLKVQVQSWRKEVEGDPVVSPLRFTYTVYVALLMDSIRFELLGVRKHTVGGRFDGSEKGPSLNRK